MSRLLAAVFSDWRATRCSGLECQANGWCNLSRSIATSLNGWPASMAACIENSLATATCSCSKIPTPPSSLVSALFRGGTVASRLQSPRDFPPYRCEVGCHFGECVALESDAWIGRGITLAKRVETVAAPNALYVTESVLSIIDLPLYGFEEAGGHALKGDHLPLGHFTASFRSTRTHS